MSDGAGCVDRVTTQHGRRCRPLPRHMNNEAGQYTVTGNRKVFSNTTPWHQVPIPRPRLLKLPMGNTLELLSSRRRA